MAFSSFHFALLSTTLALALASEASSNSKTGGDLNQTFMNSTTHGSEAGGDFQGSFTKQYAGSYTKYMSSGDQGTGGNLPQFAQQYVKGSASSFEGYMNTPGKTKSADATSGSSDYQQYMKSYAGSQGGGSSGGAQGGGYQQYMDYSKYTQQGGGSSGGAQGGDYQQYMKQYAANYAGGGAQAVGLSAQTQSNASAPAGGTQAGAQGGDYQQYMIQYAGKYTQQGGDSSGAQGGGYQQYMDYSRYTQQGGTNSGGAQVGATQGAAQGGDYQQYLTQYAGKYTQQAGSSSGGAQGGYQQYMDYSKYTQQGGGSSRGAQAVDFSAQTQSNASAQAGGSQTYMKQYAGDYAPPQQQHENMTQEEIADDFKEKYARQWAPAADAKMTQDDALHRFAGNYVSGVRNISDAKEWAARYQDKYASSYEGYQKQGQHAAEPLPCANPSDCQSVLDLQEWRKHQLKQIQSFVPEAYQSGAESAVDSQFHKNELRIENITAESESESVPRKVGQNPRSTTSETKSTQHGFLSKASAPTKLLALARSPTTIEQAPNQASAILGLFLAVGAAVALFAARKTQESSESGGYMRLCEDP